jgi:hypothetical protein
MLPSLQEVAQNHRSSNVFGNWIFQVWCFAKLKKKEHSQAFL